MRVFVLTTGRSGSTTFAKACSHITNFTSGHETQCTRLVGRLDYPDDHIEVDNRLVWFLGSLDEIYGGDPLYVWLIRDHGEVVASYERRYNFRVSIVRAFSQGIMQRGRADEAWHDVTDLLITTMEDNIAHFLKDKPNTLIVDFADMRQGFDVMCDRIGATGDRADAHAEFDIRHNAS